MSDAIQTYGIRIKSMKENLRNIKKMKKDIASIQKHQSRTRQRAMVQNKKNIAAETKFAQQEREKEEKGFKQSQQNQTKIQKQEVQRRKKVEGSDSDKETYDQKRKDYEIVQKALTKTLKREADKREKIRLAEAKRKHTVDKGRTQQALGDITEKDKKGKGEASKTLLADQLKTEEKAYKQSELTRTRVKKEEAKKRAELEKASIQQQRQNEAARIKQAVSQTTERSGQGRGTAAKSALADQLREEVKLEKEAYTINSRMNRLEKQRVNSLEKAKAAISRTKLMRKQDADAAERAAQETIKDAMWTSKTADELRDVVSREKANLSTNKRLTKEKQRQMYLQRRISESSKQFAGNYLSAFAVAGAAAGATRTGQDFQSVNNTMLAVSESSESAGENFKFVRDEAYRLGLGLTESAKGFSKMLAARGDMSVEETKNAFSGLSEMSTLLGLSAAESTRSIKALQQMMSKGVVSAEELNLGSL